MSGVPRAGVPALAAHRLRRPRLRLTGSSARVPRTAGPAPAAHQPERLRPAFHGWITRPRGAPGWSSCACGSPTGVPAPAAHWLKRPCPVSHGLEFLRLRLTSRSARDSSAEASAPRVSRAPAAYRLTRLCIRLTGWVPAPAGPRAGVPAPAAHRLGCPPVTDWRRRPRRVSHGLVPLRPRLRLRRPCRAFRGWIACARAASAEVVVPRPTGRNPCPLPHRLERPRPGMGRRVSLGGFRRWDQRPYVRSQITDSGLSPRQPPYFRPRAQRSAAPGAGRVTSGASVGGRRAGSGRGCAGGAGGRWATGGAASARCGAAGAVRCGCLDGPAISRASRAGACTTRGCALPSGRAAVSREGAVSGGGPGVAGRCTVTQPDRAETATVTKSAAVVVVRCTRQLCWVGARLGTAHRTQMPPRG